MSEATTRSVTNPFSAAIRDLKFWGRESLGPTKLTRKSYEAAIRVLEAAGKVDKDNAISWLNEAVCRAHHTFTRPGSKEMLKKAWDETSALLAALPDPPKEKDK